MTAATSSENPVRPFAAPYAPPDEDLAASWLRRPDDRTADARGSVARGLAATSGVISAAAAIMVLVFLGFVTESGALIKMLGFGLGVAILLDATVVRLVLVPATMSLLGERNWWTPAWLDRLLPRLEAEAVDGEVDRPDERVPELVP